MTMRIGLLAGRTLREHHLQALEPILADRQFEVPLMLVDARPPQTAGRKVMHHVRKGRGAYVLVLALESLLAQPARGVEAREFCRKNGIEFLETDNPYTPQISSRLRAHHLDVLALLGGFGIIRAPLLSACPRGILSYHHGDMRKYRGMPPGLWELYHGEKEVGITVQQIAAGLDCGLPIAEKHIPIRPDDTLEALQARLRLEGQGLLYAALKKVADPDFTPAPLGELGAVYTLPNFRQWVTLNARIAYRRWRCRWSAPSPEHA
jgi:folate-dependent phosphoribosylglycinamide formyltransferase PurN